MVHAALDTGRTDEGDHIMRARHGLKVGGALALAAGTIGAGALITSHAMAASTPSAKGTLTIVAMAPGSDTAITCTYDDVDLPAVPPAGTPGHTFVNGTRLSTERGPNGTDAPTPHSATAGTAGTAQSSDGTETAGTVLTAGGGPGQITTGVAVAVGAGEASATPAPDAIPVIQLNGHDARPGTPAECDALRPTVQLP
jgi:hypothetical protein